MRWLLLLALLSSPSVLAADSPGTQESPGAQGATATAEDVDVEALLDATDDLMRGQSSHAVVRMTIHTARWDRELRLEIWSRGEDRSLIRILDPPKERGIATLRVGENIWNYLPKVDRTMKVPAAMMSANWMGSHFTNDDLVKESRYTDDYDARLLATPRTDPGGRYVIELTPHPDAPVVWGRVVLSLDGETRLPLEILYYDERGELQRSMTFSEVKEMGGRRLPTVVRLVPADEAGEFTELRYEELSFDVDVPDSTFTLQALRP